MNVFRQFADWLGRLLEPQPAARSLPRPVQGAAPVPAVPFQAPPALARPERSRRAIMHEVFDTGMPVANRAALAGRTDELERLLDAVLDHRKHGIIYGARGSGKTSLSRIFGDMADERGCLVLYNLASGDIAFHDLFRPYLLDIAAEPQSKVRRSEVDALLNEPFDARRLASLLADRVERRTILMLDEFDRVHSQETKAELAALMKLLSDMRSEVSIVTIGIAANLEDLIAGHPSLRRHLIGVAVGGLTPTDLDALLRRCLNRVDLDITDDAAATIVSAAVGSPYHLRLFGLYAALQADAMGKTVVDADVASRGLQVAFAEWRDVSRRNADLLLAQIDRPRASALPAAIICLNAAMRSRVDRAEVIAELGEPGSAEQVDAMLDTLGPILVESSTAGQYVFDDSLAPQFFLLLFTRKIAPGGGDVRRGAGEDLRALLHDKGATQ